VVVAQAVYQGGLPYIRTADEGELGETGLGPVLQVFAASGKNRLLDKHVRRSFLSAKIEKKPDLWKKNGGNGKDIR